MDAKKILKSEKDTKTVLAVRVFSDTILISGIFLIIISILMATSDPVNFGISPIVITLLLVTPFMVLSLYLRKMRVKLSYSIIALLLFALTYSTYASLQPNHLYRIWIFIGAAFLFLFIAYLEQRRKK